MKLDFIHLTNKFINKNTVTVFLLAFLVGCANNENQAKLPLAASVSPPVSEPKVDSSKSQSKISTASSNTNVFTPKKLPILGSITQQTQDELAVSQFIIGLPIDGKKITEIAQSSMAGVAPNPIAVKLGYPPKGTDICNLPYSALIRAMYEQCFSEGMSYIQVSNIAGWKGEEIASSGSSVTYRWGDGKEGSMILIFENDQLVSKSQNGLKP